MRLKDKVAIVTGSGRGIGEFIAYRFAEEGAKIVISDIDLPAAQAVAERLTKEGKQAIAVKANVAIKAEVEAMVKAAVDNFGRVDILVNNAGMSVVGASQDLEEAVWRNGIDVMLTGVFLCCQAAGKEMIKQKFGKIVNIASINGIGAYPERACYCSAKAGVMALTKVLGCEWAHHNINVNAVAPSAVETDMVKSLVASGTLDLDGVIRRTPLGRLAKTVEIADSVVFLASEESRFIEGQTITVDGGWTAYEYLESWLDNVRKKD